MMMMMVAAAQQGQINDYFSTNSLGGTQVTEGRESEIDHRNTSSSVQGKRWQKARPRVYPFERGTPQGARRMCKRSNGRQLS